MEWTYAKVGIDIDKIRKGHRKVAKILSSTLGKEAFLDIGHYAGLVDIGNNKFLALHTDGVGTKVLIAQALKRYDTIGIDCIAMNANDIICLGAKPLAFVDYIALGRYDEKIIQEIAKGLKKGAKEASLAIVGGETAILPDLIAKDSFDLSGSIVGIVRKDKVITGERIREGDLIVGIESSGLHSNGYTLARKVLLRRHKLDEYIDELDKTLGEELLKPTKIYVKPIMKLIKKVDVKGIAHVTGGAFTKLSRLLREPLGIRINSLPKPKPIFTLIQKEGNISSKEMYRTFNMGIGLCVFVSKDDVENVINVFESFKTKAFLIGKVVKKKGIYINRIKIL